MNTTMTRETFDEIESLLPWHAAGTLAPRDAARVDLALGADPELARRFELVREELNETIDLNESLGAPSAQVREKLFAMIAAEPVRRPKAVSRTSFVENLFASLSPRTLAFAAGAAALALLLQAGFLAGLIMQDRAGGPSLASYGDTDSIGSVVLMRFHPQVSMADITKFLSENGVTIVGGPAKGTGLFRVQVSEKLLSQAELAAVAKKLGSDEAVAFMVPGGQ